MLRFWVRLRSCLILLLLPASGLAGAAEHCDEALYSSSRAYDWEELEGPMIEAILSDLIPKLRAKGVEAQLWSPAEYSAYLRQQGVSAAELDEMISPVLRVIGPVSADAEGSSDLGGFAARIRGIGAEMLFDPVRLALRRTHGTFSVPRRVLYTSERSIMEGRSDETLRHEFRHAKFWWAFLQGESPSLLHDTIKGRDGLIWEGNRKHYADYFSLEEINHQFLDLYGLRRSALRAADTGDGPRLAATITRLKGKRAKVEALARTLGARSLISVPVTPPDDAELEKLFDPARGKIRVTGSRASSVLKWTFRHKFRASDGDAEFRVEYRAYFPFQKLSDAWDSAWLASGSERARRLRQLYGSLSQLARAREELVRELLIELLKITQELESGFMTHLGQRTPTRQDIELATRALSGRERLTLDLDRRHAEQVRAVLKAWE